jgi:single-strand DNA-binding protein
VSDGLNRVTLIGNLGADPELKYLQNGNAVLNLRLATTKSWFDKNANERKSATQWHTVIVWGKRGEALNKILAKGRTIAIEGEIQYRQWEDQNGGKRYATDIIASEVLLLGGGKRNEGDQAGGDYDRPRGNGAGGPPADDFGGGGNDDFGGGSDIPF